MKFIGTPEALFGGCAVSDLIKPSYSSYFALFSSLEKFSHHIGSFDASILPLSEHISQLCSWILRKDSLKQNEVFLARTLCLGADVFDHLDVDMCKMSTTIE